MTAVHTTYDGDRSSLPKGFPVEKNIEVDAEEFGCQGVDSRPWHHLMIEGTPAFYV